MRTPTITFNKFISCVLLTSFAYQSLVYILQGQTSYIFMAPGKYVVPCTKDCVEGTNLARICLIG